MIFDSDETKEKILCEFLPIAAFDGWSDEALIKATKACGIEEKFLPLIFENGLMDLLQFYVESYNKKSLILTHEVENFQNLKIRQKVKIALLNRFAVEKNNRVALQRLVNFLTNPKNIISQQYGVRPALAGFKLCYKIADFIWYLIGDSSTDFNFYTKRLTLGKIIFRSLFKFIKDESSNFEQTARFIDSEIEKVMRIEAYKTKIRHASSKIKTVTLSLVTREDGSLKTPTEVVRSLPFVRLFK